MQQAVPTSATAILIVDGGGNRQWIAGRCRIAAEAGVRPGMTLAHARALLVEERVLVVPHAPQRDLRCLRALAQWASRYSPAVAPDPPDGLLLDISGCQRIFGGERRLLQRIDRDLRRLGLGARVVAAPTFAGARALARYGDEPLAIVEQEQLGEAIGGLPPAALGIDARAAEALGEVGIDRIEHLTALPRAELAARFADLLVHRLDQALGRAPERIEPLRPVEPVAVCRHFDGPVKNLEAIQQAAGMLIDQLAETLHDRGHGAAAIAVKLTRSDMVPLVFEVTLSRPNRSARHLRSLIQPRLEKAHLGFGVEAIDLVAGSTQALPHDQATRWLESSADAAREQVLGQMLDTLAGRLGARRVLRCRLHEAHLPQRTFSYVSAAETQDGNEPEVRLTPSDRPSHLLERPEPIRVIAMTDDGPPSWLEWRRHAADLRSSFGPERIEAQWWLAPLDDGKTESARDYFKVQEASGRWLWIYRRLEDGRWFVHGVWG